VTRRCVVAAAVVAGFAGDLAGQEAINTSAATQPGVGRVVVREQLRAYTADQVAAPFGSDADELQSATSVFVGLRHDLTLGAEVPFRFIDLDTAAGCDTETDLGDVRLLGKWRFHRADTGPIDTERASLLLGVSLDTGDGPSLRPGFSADSTDPILGAVYTRVSGRHGWNGALEATLATDGGADDIRYDGAWLFRAAPSAFGADTAGAWYLVGELNGRYETNGDHEVLLSPGLMYEARRWTAELSVQVPVYQDLDDRSEIDLGVVVGFRFLF
jgi:hypothetical protein